MTSKPNQAKKNNQPIKTNGPIESFYQQLVEQSPVGIFTTGLKGDILYANKAACDIVRLPMDKIVGNHFMEFLDKNSRRKSKEYILQVKEGETQAPNELIIFDSKGKKKWIEFTASPIFKGKNIVQIQISVKDISRRKQLEDYARESVKDSAVQNFISGTTYEIRSPLKGLLLLTQSLLDRYKDRDFEYIGFKEFNEIFDTLVNMRDKAKYCSETVDRLINISKASNDLSQKSGDVNKVIKDSVQVLKSSITKAGINVRFTFSNPLPLAWMGEVELGQVIVKILSNSIQSLTRGGHFDIKTYYLKKENKLRIDCIDDGIGISRENLPKVFDPFFSTKEKGSEYGAGLGLAIVQSIIHSYKGNITIKSRQNQGTRVKILLPVFKKMKKND
ncbi:MAG: PAS domain S-box protein [Candidatus Omnitrophica bacterium]|nr:PAS domain S-box protein [Candidatus Omnitrophota bacterium]